MKYAKNRGFDDFIASSAKFYKLKSINGEQGTANFTGAREFTENFQNFLKKYDKKDIFNNDESGFFWRTPPKKTYIRSSESPKGKKSSKERITLLFTVNTLGEKFKTLIIGKSKNPVSLKVKTFLHLS
ncbi:Tigger transposable element-derived protein 2 [Smittium culicis]|uniref:Tigger transposable element-derived protein 2 n=1 Tax=Smittium culicis TaxID=133412 RepID=A0A1R1Y676_9FUNG|nr:Tigger transposable element-derived protein 2 [Smittium culicis]